MHRKLFCTYPGCKKSPNKAFAAPFSYRGYIQQMHTVPMGSEEKAPEGRVKPAGVKRIT